MIRRVFGFPGRYIQGPGALSDIGETARGLGASDTVVIADPQIAEPAETIRRSLGEAGLRVRMLRSHPECTKGAARTLAKEAGACDLVIGFGGGKTIDLSKAVARSLKAQLLVAPSIASNDAPTSRLVVFYDEAHKIDHVLLTDRNPDVVLVDTEVIARAPARFFAAGMADALSKRLEVAQCLAAGGLNFFHGRPFATAEILAQAAHEAIVGRGRPAMEAVKRKEATEDVEAVVEASVLLSGLAFESGGLSLAHALLRGLSALPNCAVLLHGELVAFGALTQMAYEEREDDEIAAQLGFYVDVDLSSALKRVAAATAKRPDRELAARLTCEAPYIGNLVLKADVGGVARAIERANSQILSA